VVILHRAVHAVAQRAGHVAVIETRPESLVVQNLQLAFPRRVRPRERRAFARRRASSAAVAVDGVVVPLEELHENGSFGGGALGSGSGARRLRRAV
jgi:lauroyl/myristoyl acyltransferase